MSEDLAVEVKKIEDFKKLKATDCAPVDIYLSAPIINEDKTVTVSEPIKGYLRQLTYYESLYVKQGVLAQYVFGKEHNVPENVINIIANKTAIQYTVFYSVRDGFENSAPRLFQDESEVSMLPENTILDIYTKYIQSFDLSVEDLGESLRARTSQTK